MSIYRINLAYQDTVVDVVAHTPEEAYEVAKHLHDHMHPAPEMYFADIEELDTDEDTTVTIQLTMSLNIPLSIVSLGKEAVVEYLNTNLEVDPEFFGYIDESNISLTGESDA